MKKIFSTFITALMALSTMAQGHYSLELPYENVNGKLMVSATVDGQKGRFCFDTGAPLYISSALAKKIGTEAQRSQGIIDAAGHKLTVGSTVVGKLVLGEGTSTLTFEGPKANIIPEGNMIEGFGLDGIIGCDIMPHSVVRFDSKRQVIIITDDATPFQISPRCRMQMDMNKQNCPFVQINVGNGVIETPLFDSGSPALYSIGEETAHRAIEAGAVQELQKGISTSGFGLGGESAASESSRVKIKDLRIGMGKLRNVVSQTQPGGTLIGTSLLKYGYVTLDFEHKAFYFEPFESTPIDCYEKHWDLDITYHEGSILVAGAWGDIRSQVELGEEIIAVDGKALAKVSLEEALQGNLLKISADKATLTLRRKDQTEHTVVITKQ